MKKIDRIHLIIAIVLSIALIISLTLQYSNFKFHTFENTATKIQRYFANSEDYKIDFFEVVKQDNEYHMRNGRLKVLNSEINQDNLNLMLQVDNQETQLILTKIADNEYTINSQALSINQLGDLNLKINDDVLQLEKLNYTLLNGQNKNYRLNDVAIYQNTIHFGYLNNIQKEVISEQYPEIQIEYRYANANSKSDDPYIVFYSQSGKTNEVITQMEDLIKDVKMPNDLVLEDLPINVVIILKGEEDLVFSIDLKRK